VGTGTGVLIPLLLKITGAETITAIDFAQKMIEEAEKKFGGKGITFIAGDALKHPFEQSSFDFIICNSVFPHFENKQEALSHLGGLLKDGGLLAILHAASREKINGIHAKTGIIHDDTLPEAELTAEFLRKSGLKVEILIDNDRLYAVCARR